MIHLISSLIVGVSLLSAPIDYSTETSDSIKNFQIEEVTVLSSFNSMYKSLNLPVVILNSSDLDLQLYNSPADALQSLTGISMSRDGAWATSVSIRGLSEQRLLFLSDGDRIQTATDVAAALSLFDIESLERIEVIKGAGSVLYGTGAMGGVVNFISRTPDYAVEHREVHGNLTSGFNTVNNLWGSHGEFEFRDKQWYIGVNGSYRTAGDTNTPEGKLANSQFNDASWGAKVGIQYDPQQEILLDYQQTKAWDVGLPGGSAFPASAKVRYANVSRNQFSGEYIYKEINDYLDKLSVKLYTQNIDRKVENIPNPNGPLVILPSSKNQTVGGKLSTDWNLYDGKRLILGADVWQRRADTKRLRINEKTNIVTGEQPTPYAKMTNAGVFALYKWDISEKFGINAGARLDFIRTQNDSAFNPLFEYTIVDGVPEYNKNLNREVLFTPHTNDQFSYALHLDWLYRPAWNHQLKMSLSNSYRVASIEERFKFIDQGGITKYGKIDLKPEQGIFTNLDYSFFSENFHVKTDVFANYLFNLIAEKNMGIENGNQIFRNDNINKALFWGAEIDLNYYFGNSFIAQASASYVQGDNLSEGGYLPQIAPLNGNFSLSYQLKKLMKASAGAQWAGRQSKVAENESETEAYIIFNLAVHFLPINFEKLDIQFFAGVNNLFDTAYYNHLSTTRGILKLEPGRNIYAKAKLSF